MKKLASTLSVAAIVAASGVAFQAVAQSDAGSQPGVPGVEMNVGDNASDRGLPGVEMNVGAQGDQNNVDIGANGDQNNVDTSTLGAGPDTGSSTLGSGSDMNADQDSNLIRADRG